LRRAILRLRDFQGSTDSSDSLDRSGRSGQRSRGQYGRQTLGALHLLDKVKPKLVLGKDVRQVLTYVETGNADAGLVYATDAQASGRRCALWPSAPDSAHDPIVYPAAVVKGSGNREEARGSSSSIFAAPRLRPSSSSMGLQLPAP
jgi:molybdate transport system substrate-binding protein